MGSVFLRGDSWVGDYRVNGKTRRKTFGKKGIVTKTSAKEMLKRIEQKVKLGHMTCWMLTFLLNQFSSEYPKHVRDVVKKRSWKRDELCLRHLKDCMGDRKLPEITPKDVDDYKESRLAKVEPATVNRELSVLRHLFNLARRWKRFFNENPVSESGLISVNSQKERILTPEEEEKLLHQAILI